MTRWIMLGILVSGVLLLAFTRSTALAGLGSLMVLVGLIGGVLSLAASRIAERSRADTAMLSPEVMQAIRDKAARDAAARNPRPLPPSAD